MLKRPNLSSVKDEKILAYISALEKDSVELAKFKQRPGFKTYMAIQGQINSFNEQLVIREESRPHPQKEGEFLDVKVGFIDLFADKDSKEFERSFKYMENAVAMVERQDKLFKLLNEEEKAEVKKIAEGSSAERHIFK